MVGNHRTDDCGEPDKPDSLQQAYILNPYSFWLLFFFPTILTFFLSMGLRSSIAVICPLCRLVLLSNICSRSCAMVIYCYLVGLQLSFCRAFHWRMHLLTTCCRFVQYLCTRCGFTVQFHGPQVSVCYSEKLSRKEQCIKVSFMPIVLGLLTVFQQQTGLIVNAFLHKLSQSL